MDQHRATPLSAHEINTNNLIVTELLKRTVSNAFRHGLNLRPGRLNSANGNCVWESIIYNLLDRECFKSKTKETSKQLRIRSINLAQAQVHWLPFVESNTTEAVWNHIKKGQSIRNQTRRYMPSSCLKSYKKGLINI